MVFCLSPPSFVIQRSAATKDLVCIHVYVPEILRFALDDEGWMKSFYCLPDDNAKIIPPETPMSVNVRFCPLMSEFVRFQVKKSANHLDK